ncbi:hypothetical protein R1flu_019154 [Riccia fluitans]|uniref:GH18 domain-containing protein n=1 Tax=Riccia fluitans TaxID=41844 RepID=A0ABD1ZJE7_9MARC
MAMAWMMIHLALGLVLIHTAAAACPPAFTQYITAPSYVNPCSIDNSACAWYSFSNGADTVIVNPASGPGTAVDSNYASLVNTIRAREPSGATFITSILGYVATTYGAKSLTAAKAEIDKYNTFYKVDGIFFDEVSTDCAKTSYYATLVQYVQSHTKSPSGQDYTILNWGTNGPECFLKTTPSADNFVTFEGNYSQYQSYAPLSYMTSYAPARWYNIVYNVTQANVVSTVLKSKYNRAGWVYVTNDDSPNPFDTAPKPYTTYWQAEVNKVARTC